MSVLGVYDATTEERVQTTSEVIAINLALGAAERVLERCAEVGSDGGTVSELGQILSRLRSGSLDASNLEAVQARLAELVPDSDEPEFGLPEAGIQNLAICLYRCAGLLASTEVSALPALDQMLEFSDVLDQVRTPSHYRAVVGSVPGHGYLEHDLARIVDTVDRAEKG